MIAYKFVSWDVRPLETLNACKVYSLKEKINNGGKLNRDEKNWITEQVNSNTYSKVGVPLQGWMFSFSDVLQRYLVNQYGHWQEYYACDKTSLRNYLYGRVNEIIAA